MKNSAGATWDAATAGNAIGTWTASFGKQIDVVVSNNDGMGMSMFNAWAKDNKVPTFGYEDVYKRQLQHRRSYRYHL